MFTGTYTALVSPFHKGKLDEPAFEKLIKKQIKGGVDGLVPVGTTGESPTLTYEEHIRMIELAVRFGGEKLKVIAGTGANSTQEAIHLTKAAEAAGAHASLQVAPYYNKPSQDGLFEHFKTIAQSTKLPIVLYSIPGRCGVAIEVETVSRLSKACPNIVAIKEAGGDADRVSQLRQELDENFTILCGDDALTLPFMAVGARGVISVASNLIPKEISQMVRFFESSKPEAALKIHQQYYPLFKALFVETNPVPIKTALALVKEIHEDVRLPLTRMQSKNRGFVKKALRECGILSD